MGKTVEIRLGKDGSIKTRADGEKGPGCTEMTRFLDELFDEPVERELKAEYYEDDLVIADGLPSGYCG